jgi:hypothetical protein
MLTCLIGLLTLQLYFTISLLIRAGDQDSAVSRMINQSALDSRTLYISILSIVSILPLIFLLLVFSLWAFHCYILFHGVTTYEWIIARRKLAEEKEQRQFDAERAKKSTQLAKGKAVEEAEWMNAREAEKKRRERIASMSNAAAASSSSNITRGRGSMERKTPTNIQRISIGSAPTTVTATSNNNASAPNIQANHKREHHPSSVGEMEEIASSSPHAVMIHFEQMSPVYRSPQSPLMNTEYESPTSIPHTQHEQQSPQIDIAKALNSNTEVTVPNRTSAWETDSRIAEESINPLLFGPSMNNGSIHSNENATNTSQDAYSQQQQHHTHPSQEHQQQQQQSFTHPSAASSHAQGSVTSDAAPPDATTSVSDEKV